MKTTIDRFCNRADDYAKYRPSYSEEILPFLEEKCVIKPGIVADIGAGSGIWTKMLLFRGYGVYAVEPNEEMRSYAEKQFRSNPKFFSIAASGEHTELDNKSLDAIFLAQSFHWLDHQKAKVEFMRILKNHAPVIIIWNDRDDSHGFGKALESLIKKHSIDYEAVSHRVKLSREIIGNFFENNPEYAQFAYAQTLNFTALLGRLTSCSYLPDATHKLFPDMKAELSQLFLQHQKNDEVILPYITRVYWGYFPA